MQEGRGNKKIDDVREVQAWNSRTSHSGVLVGRDISRIYLTGKRLPAAWWPRVR